MTASRVVTTSSREYVEYFAPNGTYTFTVYVRLLSGSRSMQLDMKDRASDTVRGTTSFTATTEWQRVAVTGTVAGEHAGVRIELEALCCR